MTAALRIRMSSLPEKWVERAERMVDGAVGEVMSAVMPMSFGAEGLGVCEVEGEEEEEEEA
jgi:hypothetical protein